MIVVVIIVELISSSKLSRFDTEKKRVNFPVRISASVTESVSGAVAESISVRVSAAVTESVSGTVAERNRVKFPEVTTVAITEKKFVR